MTEFIDFEVSIEDTNQNVEEEENNEVSDNDSLKSLIDNEKIKSDKTFYHKFENVTASIDGVLKQEYDKSMGDIEKVDFSDFCEISEEENHLDEFKDSEKRINKKIQRNSFSSFIRQWCQSKVFFQLNIFCDKVWFRAKNWIM